MKAYIGNWLIPYPMTILRGRLLLCGLPPNTVGNITDELSKSYEATKKWPTELELFAECNKILETYDDQYRENFEIVNEYYASRRKEDDVDPIILVLEGASATGKSMLLLNLIQAVAATRIVSTDSIRQVLRTQSSRDEYPHLFCHTYQAHKFKQVGPDSLSAVLRGFLAQMQLIRPKIVESVRRISTEGAEAIVEGVHIVPGDLSGISDFVIEVMIEPGEEMHRSMFMSKKVTAGLKTVSGATKEREREFRHTRKIQEYMLDRANEAKIPIIELESYRASSQEITSLILNRIEQFIS